LEQDILRKILDSAGANAKESPHMKTHLATSAIHLTICATALLLSNGGVSRRTVARMMALSR
jgi:hypothetical protein